MGFDLGLFTGSGPGWLTIIDGAIISQKKSGSCSDVMLSNKIVKKDENDALEKQSQSPDLNPTVHGRKKTMMFCTLDVANVAQSGVQD